MASSTNTVKKGESFAAVAKRLKTNMQRLSKANGGVVTVHAGDKLNVPGAGYANAPDGVIAQTMGNSSGVTQLPAGTLPEMPGAPGKANKLNLNPPAPVFRPNPVTQLPAGSVQGKRPGSTPQAPTAIEGGDYRGTRKPKSATIDEQPTPANMPTTVGPQAGTLPGQEASAYAGGYGTQALVEAFDAAVSVGDPSMMPGYISYDQAVAYTLTGGGTRKDVDAVMTALGYVKSPLGGYTFKGWATPASSGGGGGYGSSYDSSPYVKPTNSNPSQASMSWRVASG